MYVLIHNYNTLYTNNSHTNNNQIVMCTLKGCVTHDGSNNNKGTTTAPFNTFTSGITKCRHTSGSEFHRSFSFSVLYDIVVVATTYARRVSCGLSLASFVISVASFV